MDRALANPETRAAYEAALERDSEPAPDADREAGGWEGDDLPTPDEAERMGWTV
jgi:hypothetical protein